MIEVGEYVRTKKGKIDKVINNNYYMSQYIECEKGIVDKENIAKHSKEIIDLIEVGDIVHYKISNISIKLETKGYLENIIVIEDKEQINEIKNNTNIEVLEILSKELYKENCYTVERKKE